MKRDSIQQDNINASTGRKRFLGWIIVVVEFDPVTRHFPFGFLLEPIQARNVSYSNNLRLPRV